MSLLSPKDPYPVLTRHETSKSPFFLTVDHADRLIPEKLADLGVSQADLDRHIAYDIGILEVSNHIADRLNAPLVAQRYSRLVIDCNRRPGVSTSIPETSDGVAIPANCQLGDANREARRTEIFHPYHQRIEQMLEARSMQESLYIAMHSFTPSMAGFRRPWHIGLLTHDDRRLAIPILTALHAIDHIHVGDNDPYAVCPVNDYGLMIHGHSRGLLHVGFEIRQDLIAHEAGQIEWAEKICTVLEALPIGKL